MSTAPDRHTRAAAGPVAARCLDSSASLPEARAAREQLSILVVDQAAAVAAAVL
jgi:hypothetical protein